jgi:hypothetical protein
MRLFQFSKQRAWEKSATPVISVHGCLTRAKASATPEHLALWDRKGALQSLLSGTPFTKIPYVPKRYYPSADICRASSSQILMQQQRTAHQASTFVLLVQVFSCVFPTEIILSPLRLGLLGLL